MRKLLIGLLVVVLLVAGAWLAIRALVDAERHEEALRAALESATGWSASFESVDVSVARGLRLDMSELRLVDRRGGSVIEAPRAIFRAGVSALLKGELVLREVELLRPEIVIARDPAKGWRWPQPGRAAPGGPELAELTIKGGRLTLAGPVASRTLNIEEISAVLTPPTGRVWGTALMSGAAGRVKWIGRLGEGVQVTIEGAEAGALAGWLPADARPSGLVDLALRVDAGGTRAEGRLDAEELRLFPEREALAQVGVDFSIVGEEGAWRLDAVTLEAGDLEARAEGWLAPFDAQLIIEEAPLAPALAASAALARLTDPVIEDPGGGRLSVTLHLGGEGPSRWWWSSLEVQGARLTRSEGGPALHDAALELSRARRGAEVTGRVRGTLAQGSLVASLSLPSAERVELSGSLRGASTRDLLGAGGQGSLVSLRGRAVLSRDAARGIELVAGELRAEGRDWDEPSWELGPRLVAACPPTPPPGDEDDDGTLDPVPPPPPGPPAGLPLEWSATIDLARAALEELEAAGPAWRATGAGRYAAAEGALELDLTLAPLGATRSAFRAACGRGLGAADAPPWPLSLALSGSLAEPRVAAPPLRGEVRAGDEPVQSAP